MPSVSLTGKDTIQINGAVISDLADGDPVVLSYAEDVANVKAGKDGNVIYALNNMGFVGDCVLRVIMGSFTDKFLNSLFSQMIQDFSLFTLLTGAFSKRVGDGQSVVSTKVYQCTGGVFKKQIEAKTSASGDAEQSVAVYPIRFGNVSISIQ